MCNMDEAAEIRKDITRFNCTIVHTIIYIREGHKGRTRLAANINNYNVLSGTDIRPSMSTV